MTAFSPWPPEPTETMKLLNSDTAAITAEPMAMPLVMALVVLPTASRSARICRAVLYCAPRPFPLRS